MSTVDGTLSIPVALLPEGQPPVAVEPLAPLDCMRNMPFEPNGQTQMRIR